jgi:hypothetical protein
MKFVIDMNHGGRYLIEADYFEIDMGVLTLRNRGSHNKTVAALADGSWTAIRIEDTEEPHA